MRFVAAAFDNAGAAAFFLTGFAGVDFCCFVVRDAAFDGVFAAFFAAFALGGTSGFATASSPF